MANNGEDAVFKVEKNHFDLNLMDLQVPRIDGYSALKAIRRLGFKMPVVAVTAHALKSERDRCFEAGFDGYLPKPLDRPVLLRIVAKLILS